VLAGLQEPPAAVAAVASELLGVAAQVEIEIKNEANRKQFIVF
jgi:hypothetical protein